MVLPHVNRNVGKLCEMSKHRAKKHDRKQQLGLCNYQQDLLLYNNELCSTFSGWQDGLMRSKPVHQLIVLKPRIVTKQGGQRLTSVSGDLAFVFISCHIPYTYM